jgi:alpha-tubulin suppressor-like RCC1 family protein
MQGLPGSASALSVGAAHVCALVNGAVWCLGQNDSGQLGDGTTDAGSLTAVQVWGLQQGVLDLAGGADFTCALKTDSTVWCWGSIDLRLFGGSSSTQSNVPVLVSPSGQ